MGETSASSEAAVSATCSAPRRDRMKARVRTEAATRSASRSAASEEAARRSGAPFSPVNWVSAGCQSASDTSPRGEESPVTGSTSSPVSRDAWSAGAATVAEASTNVGEAP